MIDGFLIWGEKILGKGEDSQPVKIISSDLNKGVLCVCDGMGGAGAAIYDYNNTELSGAFIAANECKTVVELLANEFINSNDFDGYKFIREFESEIKNKLNSIASLYDSKPSRLKSSLIKKFPTTIAGIYFRMHEIKFESFCFWAGDSRCYELNPKLGLIQITTDDLKNKNDSFENLKEESPMSNYINADNSFKINVRIIENNSPSIIFSCTDGVFGFFSNPFTFEYSLLEALFNAVNEDEWQVNIVKSINNVTGDDYSLSCSLLGFSSFDELKIQFSDRFSFLNEKFIKPFHQISQLEDKHRLQFEESKLKKKETEQNLWDAYKNNYEFKYESR